MNDKMAPFVWPQPLQFPLVAAVPHFLHDPPPQFPDLAHYNQGARRHWQGPSWKAEDACYSVGHSFPQQDLILGFPGHRRGFSGRGAVAVAGCCT